MDFQKGSVNTTLFLKKHKHDLHIVQIYVNDIIFRATNQDLCEHLLRRYKMSLK